MLTLEQFLEVFYPPIRKVGWNNVRVYRLGHEDTEDIFSELHLLSIAWYRKYYEKFQSQPDAVIAQLLMKHLNHKMQEYMGRRVRRHWVDATPAHSIDNGEEVWEFELEDPRQLKQLESVEHTWVYRALDMLSKEDQELVCKRFALRGHDETSGVDLGSDKASIAVRRFRSAVVALQKGKKTQLYKGRGRPSTKTTEMKKRIETQILELMKQGLDTIPDIAKATNIPTKDVRSGMEELVLKGIIKKLGFQERKGKGGPHTRLFALCVKTASPSAGEAENHNPDGRAS